MEMITSEELDNMIENLERAWNRGDLESVCAAYSEEARYISASGKARGRENILDLYRKKYPDVASMGTLSLAFIEYDASEAADSGGGTIRYKLNRNGTEKTGLSLISFEKIDGKVFITRDIS